MTLLKEMQNGETVIFEFKETRSKDSLKPTKTIVAFANGKRGRYVFGIEDVLMARKAHRLYGVE